MKKILLLIAGLLAGASAIAQDTSQVTYKTTSHDFGRIQETDGPVSFTFEFTNTSSTPFIIENISTTCGCTTPEYSRQPIAPGGSGIIKVIYDPTGRGGAFNNPVVVTSNNRRDRVRLSIRGEVVPRPQTLADLFPYELSDNGLRAATSNLIFGYVGRGTKKSKTLEIVNDGPGTLTLGFRPTPQSDTPAHLYKIAVTPTTLAPGQRGTVTFTYDLTDTSEEVYGPLATAFALTAGGRPVSAYATATDDFTTLTEAEKVNAPRAALSSQFHHFGTLGTDKTVSYDVRITNGGGRPLVIRRVVAGSARVSYSLPQTSVAPGEVVVLKAILKTPSRPERVSESLSIVVNDPERPMREIRLGANVE